MRELGAHQPYAFQATSLNPDSRYFVSFEVWVVPSSTFPARLCSPCPPVHPASFPSPQGIENGLDRVGSFVTPAAVTASREVRVVCVGRDKPPQPVPHQYPRYSALPEPSLSQASMYSSLSAGGPAPLETVGALLVTVRRAQNLTNKDLFKVACMCVARSCLLDLFG